MPIIDGSDFTPVRRFRNGHYNTFIPSLFYDNPVVDYQRYRLDTPDHDFLDIDESLVGSSKAVVICHGLEGSSSSGYMLHFADYFNKKGWDVICPNYRGCSGVINQQLRMYNSGTTDDIDLVVRKTAESYQNVVLIGFSLGGNLVLKYLGEQKYNIPDNVDCGVAISAPVHLSNASQELLRMQNFAYQIRFLATLIKKAIAKKKQFPKEVDLSKIYKMYNLYQFDNYFTAPIYGYRDAEDYYEQNSSLPLIPHLERPALLINALDDPFLGELCYPYNEASNSDLFHFCAPKYGGHVGFAKDQSDRQWMKNKALDFISSVSRSIRPK